MNGEWVRTAACAQPDVDPNIMTPAGDDYQSMLAGMGVCNTCPVRMECAQSLVEHPRINGYGQSGVIISGIYLTGGQHVDRHGIRRFDGIDQQEVRRLIIEGGQRQEKEMLVSNYPENPLNTWVNETPPDVHRQCPICDEYLDADGICPFAQDHEDEQLEPDINDWNGTGE